jgi:hypothetical protein
MGRSKTSGHTVTGDAREVWALIQNAKANGIELASVSVGSCRVELRGGNAAVPRADSDPPVRGPRGGIYQDFGGDMFARQQRANGAATAAQQQVTGEDFQPALGVEE